MKIKIHILALGLSLFMTTFMTTGQVHASLGGSSDSVKSERKAMAAAKGDVTVRSGYTVEEMVSGATTVREYISLSGVVFGIAWNGMVHPDLTPLLGPYAGDYEKKLRETPRKLGQRYSQVKTNEVVVEKWGHMRNLQGRAYAPVLIPSGVNIDEIK